MRRFKSYLILAAIALIIPFTAAAEDITLKKATATAEQFFRNCGVATRSGSGSRLTLVNADEINQTRSASEACYYIFNREGGGFVIISALDAALPVLAYSLEHSFVTKEDGMPENLADMLELYRYQIKERRRSGVPAMPDELAKWNEVATPTRAGIPEAIDLQTADWGQGSPFNRLCPLDTNGKKTITGCTATAISEVMHFHKWPKAGHGTLPGYTKTNNIVIPDLPLGHEYQWDKMLPKYKNVSYTEEEADAVARLMYDVGVMCQAKYGNSATSAGSVGGVPKLATYMYYDKSILIHYHNYLTDDQWRTFLREEIGAGRPALCYANIPAGGAGHNFVIDGYDAEGRFLVNFGWNGGSNGYYHVGAFYNSYNIGQIGYIRVMPDKGGSYDHHMYLRRNVANDVVYEGMTYISGSVIPGSTFKIRFGAVYNVSTVEMDCEIQFGHYNKNGELKGYLRNSPLSTHFTVGNYKWWSGVNINVPGDAVIERGDYMEPLYRAAGEAEWKQFDNAGNEEDKIVGRLPLDLNGASTITCKKGEKTFVLNSYIGVKWTLTDPDGGVIRTSNTTSATTTFNLSKYDSGTYTLDLSYAGQTASVKLTL
ncbi:MAG: C10 family peptidase [Bacteroidales bacterium]|nr:C10 family peptidase [Bacteroidales bacterium]